MIAVKRNIFLKEINIFMPAYDKVVLIVSFLIYIKSAHFITINKHF